MPTTDPYLSRREVAKLLGVTTRTVDQWAADPRTGLAEIAFHLPSGRKRWLESQVRAWVEGRRAKAVKKVATS